MATAREIFSALKKGGARAGRRILSRRHGSEETTAKETKQQTLRWLLYKTTVFTNDAVFWDEALTRVLCAPPLLYLYSELIRPTWLGRVLLGVRRHGGGRRRRTAPTTPFPDADVLTRRFGPDVVLHLRPTRFSAPAADALQPAAAVAWIMARARDGGGRGRRAADAAAAATSVPAPKVFSAVPGRTPFARRLVR